MVVGAFSHDICLADSIFCYAELIVSHIDSIWLFASLWPTMQYRIHLRSVSWSRSLTQLL